MKENNDDDFKITSPEDLKKEEIEEQNYDEEIDIDKKNKTPWVFIVSAVILFVIIAAYFLFVHFKSKKVEEVKREQPIVQEDIQEESGKRRSSDLSGKEKDKFKEDKQKLPEIVFQETKEIEKQLKKSAKSLSNNPLFEKWLSKEDLIEKFVASVSNIANGENPRAHLKFLKPEESFKVMKIGGSIFIDPEAYDRYDKVTNVFLSLKTEECVSLYKKYKPAFQKVYERLGYPEKNFDNMLLRAISVVLKAPVKEGKIKLKEKIISYAFVNDKLENMNEVHKQIIRFGPGNTLKIKKKLLEFKTELED